MATLGTRKCEASPARAKGSPDQSGGGVCGEEEMWMGGALGGGDVHVNITPSDRRLDGTTP
eukprot:8849483-Pyramimonas_sp.AAC.1